MNFNTLCERVLMLESGSRWAILPNPPNNAIIGKKAAKELKSNHTLRAAFVKAMKNWEQKRHGRSWEVIRSKYAYQNLNMDPSAKIVAFDVGGENHNRALGYIDDKNDYHVLLVMTHEEYNKIV
jgi:mRNA-degrading endonuclease HigB of HigAB toxin-antitoxin module